MMNLRFRLSFLIGFIMILQATPLISKTYYADPVNGSINNAGDFDNPWSTLEQVFASNAHRELGAGDSLLLMNGHHGAASIKGMFSDVLVIAPYNDHQPSLTNAFFDGARKIKLVGMTISPELSESYKKVNLVEISYGASEIIVQECFGYSVLDNSSLTQSEWSTTMCSGALILGNDNIIRDCHFLNVRFGITAELAGKRNRVEHNIIENFSADGMRGIGDYSVFEYNTVKNCYDVDDNHDDGFQSWSRGPDGVGKYTVRGVVLRGNTIINQTDPNQKFPGPLQGVGCFDGMYEDWVIENNVVIVNHWHGISLYGAKNCKIVNNTLIDLNDSDPGPPWIKITAHKNGDKSTDNIVKNNLATAVSNDAGIGQVGYNMIVKYSEYDDYFVDAENFDLSLKAGARAIDRGTDVDAADIDILGTPRPQGDKVDIGAYEYKDDTGVRGREKSPTSFKLNSYPNPFNPQTVVTFHMPRSGHVQLKVFNVRGERVATLVDEMRTAGEHTAVFDASTLPSGLYLCSLNTNGGQRSLKMLLQK